MYQVAYLPAELFWPTVQQNERLCWCKWGDAVPYSFLLVVEVFVLTMENHWVREAKKVPSPNHNERPQGEVIDLVVVHNISLPPGQFGGPYIDDFFQNRLAIEADPFFAEIQDLQVSAHFLIRRDGAIHQYVPCDKRAWHAGQSRWCGREVCNDFSIGIELEGTDSTAFTDAQYAQLSALIKLLQKEYPHITNERIVGHSDIAPGRKTDPGPHFNWQRLTELLTEE